ncbi:MAG TPA: hypothetical protein VNL36_07330, partial [Bacteroidota bacterium]|nr:hypothetical protein [Bacteroidota bacterium]
MKALFSVVVVLVIGCAGSSTTSTAPGRNERLITAVEIATTNARNAQEAIERLRPRWLSRMPLTVYLNDVYTSLSLRDILVGEIETIELLSAADATTKYGTNHARGAIVVKTK